MIGMPFVPTPDNVRLPGPHYVLENLHTMQSLDDEANRQKSASLADQYLRKRSAGSSRGSQLSGPSPVPSNAQINYGVAPPDVPFYLAQIRASNAAPMTTNVSGSTADAAPQQPYQQQQQQPFNSFAANYEFGMTGILANIPTFPLVSPETQLAMPATPYDMTASLQSQHMATNAMSPHEQFLLASQQQQLGMYQANYGGLPPQEDQSDQVFDMPYRGFG
jgi:hypothetical protein